MKTSPNDDLDYAMKLLKILSWPVGTWPLEEYNLFSSLRFFLSIFCLIVTMVLVTTEICLDSSDPGKTMDSLVLSISGILSILKLYQFRFCREGLVETATLTVKDYEVTVDVEKRAILRRHAYMGRMAGVAVIGSSNVGATLFMIVAIVVESDVPTNVTNDAPNYPLPSEYTMALIKMPAKYSALIMIVEFLLTVNICFGNLGSDSLFFGILFHLCGQVAILNFDLRKHVKPNEGTVENFNALIKKHKYLLRLANMLNDTISFVMIAQLSTSCLLICTSGFQFLLALQVKNIVITIKAFVVAFTLLVQLFAYSYVGDYLKRQLEEIGDSAYNSNWYDLPANLSKEITFVIQRAQDPVQLTAGKFFVVNMETFMSIVKTSMSYLSVLRVMIKT